MSAGAAVPREVASAIARTQNAFDPYAPWLLLALLLLAGVLLRRYRQRTSADAGGRRAGGFARGAVAPLPDLPQALCLAAPLALLWAALAWAVHTGPQAWVTRLDAQAAHFAQSVTTPLLHWLALRLSDLGDVTALTVLTVVVAAWLWWGQRAHALAVAWLLSISANSLAVRVLKNLFERARPESASALVTSGYSFPSGHAAGALMVLGLLAWVLHARAGQRWRPWIVVVAAALIAGIAASRVLLGVHYLSDVLGGLLWSATTLLLTAGVIKHAGRW
ncbi:phosphatase PAP2 family protein [Ottowia testudinis]|uniref:Phosphatase PAP2 family protein n=1 Tax=Ottowia testudinis TaxID=2816950 RepID=A0A975CKI9_9BURK|nr:phosphatase PAP2 family protein [Ottowia testudinis]QTD45884.1 phosphatase PAP2 family protein [Ottowia testudinis]